jgi:hypothetical protein
MFGFLALFVIFVIMSLPFVLDLQEDWDAFVFFTVVYSIILGIFIYGMFKLPTLLLDAQHKIETGKVFGRDR